MSAMFSTIAKNVGRGLTIAILALASLSAMVHHDDAIAAGAGNGGGNGGGNDGRGGNAGAGSASESKGKNASNKGKDSRATLNSDYEKWLLELLKE